MQKSKKFNIGSSILKYRSHSSNSTLLLKGRESTHESGYVKVCQGQPQEKYTLTTKGRSGAGTGIPSPYYSADKIEKRRQSGSKNPSNLQKKINYHESKRCHSSFDQKVHQHVNSHKKNDKYSRAVQKAHKEPLPNGYSHQIIAEDQYDFISEKTQRKILSECDKQPVSPQSRNLQGYQAKKFEQRRKFQKQSNKDVSPLFSPKNVPKNFNFKTRQNKISYESLAKSVSQKKLSKKTDQSDSSVKKYEEYANRNNKNFSPSNKKQKFPSQDQIKNKRYTPRNAASSFLDDQNQNSANTKQKILTMLDTVVQSAKNTQKNTNNIPNTTKNSNQQIGKSLYFYKEGKKMSKLGTNPFQDKNFRQNLQKKERYMRHQNKRESQTTSKDFTFLKKLGKGQNGQIYSAVHAKTGIIVALKHFQQKKVIVDYLIDEMKIQLFCAHENILPALGYIIERMQEKKMRKISVHSKTSPKKDFQRARKDTEEFNIFIIMEKGDSNLFSVIKSAKRLSEKRAAKYAEQIMRGIHFLHLHNIIHRDLKPENIIMVNDVCKITDFGWSIITSEERETFCGTLEYVSPEVASGRKYDRKIDAWSVGVLIFEMLTGEAPFDSSNILERPTEEYRKRILNRLPSTVSEECRELIALLLRINPDKRLSIEEALSHRWFRHSTRPSTLDKQSSILEDEILKIMNTD